MSRRADRDLVSDIHESIRRIQNYVADIDYNGFLENTLVQDAVIRNIGIIGEASKLISSQLRNAHPGLPWKQMAGSRDRLIHDYFGVNLDIVWQIVSAELPVLLAELQQIHFDDGDGGQAQDT